MGEKHVLHEILCSFRANSTFLHIFLLSRRGFLTMRATFLQADYANWRPEVSAPAMATVTVNSESTLFSGKKHFTLSSSIAAILLESRHSWHTWVKWSLAGGFRELGKERLKLTTDADTRQDWILSRPFCRNGHQFSRCAVLKCSSFRVRQFHRCHT